MELKDFFIKYPKIALAFSGGVDSSYLLYAAKKYAKECIAYYVNSDFQPEFELDDARKLCAQLGMPLKEIKVDVLSDSKIIQNTSERCYFCKINIFSTILKNARDDGFSVVIDGTNASDDVSDRPGFKALNELKVLSPLRECALTKSEIRKLSKKAGLFTWNKPSYSCLATRQMPCHLITKDALTRTEESENFLFSLGFSNFRVRTLVLENMEECAGIELSKKQYKLFLKYRSEINLELKKHYSKIFVNLEARSEQ